MMTPLDKKSSTKEIQARFDNDVERFSQLETGQQATIDAPLVLDLVAQTAALHLRRNDVILDLGCGAGNFTLRILQEVHPLECHLADLSQPMLTRASQRVEASGVKYVQTYHSDLRDLDFEENSFDCILAGAVLHHLRDDEDWEETFEKLYKWLKPEGRIYVSDLVSFDERGVHDLMWKRYGDYLESIGGPEYKEKVFAYIDKEDSPRSLPFQLGLLRYAGFSHYDILHRNSVFACYYGEK